MPRHGSESRAGALASTCSPATRLPPPLAVASRLALAGKSNADIDVHLHLADDNFERPLLPQRLVARVSILLTSDALFRRRLVEFGPTVLRGPACYTLLRLANIQPGEIVLDPFCGCGSIGIEGVDSQRWPSNIFLNGDAHPLAVQHAAANLAQPHLRRRAQLDCLRFNACQLPLRSGCVDAIVSDMPFGKRSGSRFSNWALYKDALAEFSRVCHPLTGRLVLLTGDKRAMGQAIRQNQQWMLVSANEIRLGNLRPRVYVLMRPRGEPSVQACQTETTGNEDDEDPQEVESEEFLE
eukprot:m.288200 g.288200  ORF g.288200 m.288200 type:complete len:296 (+) comp55035_c0_seq11:609-1496(+)